MDMYFILLVVVETALIVWLATAWYYSRKVERLNEEVGLHAHESMLLERRNDQLAARIMRFELDQDAAADTSADDGKVAYLPAPEDQDPFADYADWGIVRSFN